MTLTFDQPTRLLQMFGLQALVALRIRSGLTMLALAALSIEAVAQDKVVDLRPIGTVTLTQGAYPEIFENDTLRWVGNALFNTQLGKVVAIRDRDAVYRLGFQGQEKDDEIHGATGTSYSYEYRIHDPRVGRFLSIDPLAAKYPFYSPYAFSGNRVLDAIELEGLEPLALNPMNKPLTTEEYQMQGKVLSNMAASLIDGPTYVLSTLYQGIKNGGEAAGRGLTGHPNPSGAFDDTGPVYGFTWENGFQAENAPMFQSDLPLNGNGGRVMAGTANMVTLPMMFGGGNTTTSTATTTTVYRVESAANARLSISAAGDVAVQGENMLFLNFGQKARASSFLERRIAQGFEGSQVKSFEVPSSFLNKLKSNAVLESEASQFPGAPLRVDLKIPDQFGLRPQQIQELKSTIVQGSGKTH